MNLIIENKSNANKEIVYLFYSEINKLDERIKKIIEKKSFKFTLANKYSDVRTEFEEPERYIEDYSSAEKRDKLIRGLSDSVINAICVFSNTNTPQTLICILYHEIGHLLDFYYDYDNPCLSMNQEFIDAYKKDFVTNWEKISQDKRFRLVHYIQDSTLEKISKTAIIETFAMCFAKINGHDDDIDIMGLYFPTCIKVCKKIVEKFLETIDA